MTKPTPRLTVLLVALTALVTACGIRPSIPIEGGPAPTEDAEGVVIYLLNGTTLTRVIRPLSPQPGQDLKILAEGITIQERTEGLTTEIPPDADPVATDTNGGITVTVKTPLKKLSSLAQAQLICTAAPKDAEAPVPVTLSDGTETLPPQTCPFQA